MAERSGNRVAQGSWVELHQTLLDPGQRAPQVPDETQRVPLELCVKGCLVREAALGEEAEVVTPAGRTLRGTLRSVFPAYTHSFGPPVPELLAARMELRVLLERGAGGGRGGG